VQGQGQGQGKGVGVTPVLGGMGSPVHGVNRKELGGSGLRNELGSKEGLGGLTKDQWRDMAQT
jgi:hypothetical protein